MKYFLLLMMLLMGTMSHADSPYESTKNLPELYQGRFRSLDSAAQLWLYEFHHKRSFKTTTALELLWDLHLRGSTAWNDTPLFWVHYARTKELLGLDLQRDRFSFNELFNAIDTKGPAVRDDAEVAALIAQLNAFSEDTRSNTPGATNKSMPLAQQLERAGTSMRMLPLRHSPGTWISLKALEIDPPVGNFTEFTDKEFDAIGATYRNLKEAARTGDSSLRQTADSFAQAYTAAYQRLAGKPYLKAAEKALTYPSTSVLAMETFYYRTPLVDVTIALYAFALFAFLLASKRAHNVGWGLLLCGLAIHTFTLVLRSYILGRPPVTNMFETVIYVPWIALILATLVGWKQRSIMVVTAGCFAAIALLVLLKISDLDARMENVQAVLDSQFWLIIHVLMVVGSYGAFILSGALGHLYLLKHASASTNSAELAPLARGILTTLYVGVGLLIPGTILGGIWAAESWGRFWDWDPKESWAFISACVYLIVIHAYTFKKVGDLGLAIGSIIGVISISFTWYGVNYILGTGLHSYGFGSGSTTYYFVYLVAEALFLATTLILGRRISRDCDPIVGQSSKNLVK